MYVVEKRVLPTNRILRPMECDTMHQNCCAGRAGSEKESRVIVDSNVHLKIVKAVFLCNHFIGILDSKLRWPELNPGDKINACSGKN